ncbi:Aste57867_9828 [Aphanomyces stellatus]|uniref:Aste57867_9828 protein n=1 Tax=Aphanomyces stellatus TaxID=120398 RepID=A0A485KP60_9STRA|nr:hypothetical protein As57867_009789 [Aphanomyces stellatus]VFT86707.1 Aste57867_9828 [Aphanomyces stellatus]
MHVVHDTLHVVVPTPERASVDVHGDQVGELDARGSTPHVFAVGKAIGGPNLLELPPDAVLADGELERVVGGQVVLLGPVHGEVAQARAGGDIEGHPRRRAVVGADLVPVQHRVVVGPRVSLVLRFPVRPRHVVDVEERSLAVAAAAVVKDAVPVSSAATGVDGQRFVEGDSDRVAALGHPAKDLDDLVEGLRANGKGKRVVDAFGGYVQAYLGATMRSTNEDDAFRPYVSSKSWRVLLLSRANAPRQRARMQS